MNKKTKQIKRNESSPRIIKKILTKNQIKEIKNLYKNLPIEINNG